MIYVKKRYLLSILTVVFLLTLSYAGAQDTAKIGIEKGNAWEFKIVENTLTDDYGDIDTFEISESEGGEVAVGDTFEFEVTEEVSSTGTYECTYDNGEIVAVGTNDLGEFGSDAIFTDWEYWETDAENSDLFDQMDVTITNGADVFTAEAVIDGAPFVDMKMTVTVSYYKSNGVMKSANMVWEAGDNTEELLVENVTGVEPMKVPGFGFITAIVALVSIPLISKNRK